MTEYGKSFGFSIIRIGNFIVAGWLRWLHVGLVVKKPGFISRGVPNELNECGTEGKPLYTTA